MRDGAHGEGLPGTGPGDDPDAGAWALLGDGDALGEGGQLGAARRPEEGLDIETEAELDGLTGGAGGRDDDEAPTRIPRPDEGLVVGGEIGVADRAERFARGGYGVPSRGFRSRGAAGRLADGEAAGPAARDADSRRARACSSKRSPIESRSVGP